MIATISIRDLIDALLVWRMHDVWSEAPRQDHTACALSVPRPGTGLVWQFSLRLMRGRERPPFGQEVSTNRCNEIVDILPLGMIGDGENLQRF